MTDTIKLIRLILLTNPDLIELLSSEERVYGGNLPKSFDPADGPAVVVSIRGGRSEEEMPTSRISVGIRTWAPADRSQVARDVYGAVFDTLQGLTNYDFSSDGFLLSSLEESTGQDIIDPDTGFVSVQGFFSCLVRNQIDSQVNGGSF